METAVTYNRFSPGPDQREESITGQLRENHRLAKQKDLIVIHDYIDRCITGRTNDRPQFQRMIRDAEKGHFKYVICYQTSRFARNSYDAIVYKKKLAKYGVKVIYSKMGIPEGPEGIILERVMEALDEYYSEELKQKIVRGQYDNALQNKTIGGRVPLGYKTDENGKFIVDEEKSVIVREIFTRYAAGEKAVSICEDLNNRGIRTGLGKEFGKNSLHGMFSNTKYLGIYSFKSSDPEYKDVYHEDAFPAIITKELFEKVRKRVERNKRKTSKRILEDVRFLLSGKAYDGDCGAPFIGDSGTSKNGSIYYYYTCSNKKAKKGCKTKSIKKEWLEDLVVEVTQDKVLQKDFIEFVADCILQIQDEDTDFTMLKVVEGELKTVKESLRNILTAIEKGIITDTTKDRLIELESRQAQLESQITFEKAKLKAPKVTKDHVIYFLEKFAKGDINDPVYKEEVINLFVNSIVLNTETITIAYNYTGENDLVEVDIAKYKDLSDGVRIGSKWWRIGDSNS